MKEILVRPAEVADLEELFLFEQGIILTERPFDPTLKKGKIHYYDLENMITAPDVEVVVAVKGEKIIGSGYARIEKSKHYLEHTHHAYLGFMFVRPEFRGIGVNQSIINALAEWAKSRGLNELRLDVYAENESAIRAYEKAGFSKYLVNMRLGLDDTRS